MARRDARARRAAGGDDTVSRRRGPPRADPVPVTPPTYDRAAHNPGYDVTLDGGFTVTTAVDAS